MYGLILLACVGHACEYTTTPPLYATEQRCAAQAAILAGMVAGRRGDPYATLIYRFTCVVDGHEVARLVGDGKPAR